MFLKRLDERAKLMGRMSEAVGVDWTNEFVHLDTAASTYRGCVIRCARCDHADACTTLLDESADSLSAAPNYCPNKDALSALA